MNSASEQFLKRAHETFEGKQKDATVELEKRKQAIDALLKPLKETLDKHAEAVVRVEKDRVGSYQALREQVGVMKELGEALRGETSNLVKALRRPEVRGRWGEVQLKRVAELAGMIPHCDFKEQETTNSEDGQLRPDMVVKLPAGRQIIVDAKTVLDGYLDSLNCDDDTDRGKALDRHVRHIDERARQLSLKGYQHQFDRVPDFVVLFIPGESFLQAAVQRDPELLERAMNRGVVIATPTTLITLLRAVELGWREERVAEHAEEIRTLGMQLHERVAVVFDHADKLGKHLGNAVGSYNGLLNSMESRLLVTARKFKELGADSPKELPAEGAVQLVEEMPRVVTVGDGNSTS